MSNLGDRLFSLIKDIINIILGYFTVLVLFLSNIFGVQREVISILLIEIFLLLFTLIWIRTRSLRLKRKIGQLITEAEISKKISSIELPRIEMFKISFLSLRISMLYAVSIIIMIVSMFITILAFQPYDPYILVLSIAMYGLGFIILLYAWILTKKFALNEIKKIKNILRISYE